MSEFHRIVANLPDLQALDTEPPMLIADTEDPRSTTGERGGLTLAASLVAAGLAVDDWRVQIACFVGASIVGSATVLSTRGIVASRNMRMAAEVDAAAYNNDVLIDEDEEN